MKDTHLGLRGRHVSDMQSVTVCAQYVLNTRYWLCPFSGLHSPVHLLTLYTRHPMACRTRRQSDSIEYACRRTTLSRSVILGISASDGGLRGLRANVDQAGGPGIY